MLSYRTTLIFAFLFLTTHVKELVTIPFNFSAAFHAKELPLKKMHALCMEIWGTIDAGIHDESVMQVFKENHILLLSRIMKMQSMFDILLVQLSKIMNENPDYYDHILTELEHLHEVLQDAHKTFQNALTSDNTYSYAVSHILELIIQKIEFLLQTRLAISPYYAFSRFLYYPNAITPLFVPTYRFPVTPIS